MITLNTIDSALHSVEIKNAAGQAIAIDGSGFITTNVNGTITVTATDLDIRDLTSASDSVEIKTAAGQALTIDGSGFITANVNGTVTVTATDLDIRDLTSASDSVEIKTAAGQALTIESDGSINANTIEKALDTWQVSQQTVTNVAAELAATPLANRVRMIIQNIGNLDLFLAPTNSVSTSDLKLPKGTSFEFPYGATADVWAISTAAGGTDVRVAEYAD